MKLINRVCILLFVLLFALAPGVSALNVVDTVLQDVWDSTGQSIRISFVSSESGWDVAEETALTNTVHPLVTFTHTTSDTPAAGIGLSLDWYQETAPANTELGARIAVVTSDVTAASEDFRFDWMLMTAGAAPATKMSLGSTGVLTLVNAATLDNATNGTLTITEPTIAIVGSLTVDTDVLSVDATNDIVEVNGFFDMPYVEVTANSYTVTSASKASYYVVNYTDTGAVNFCLDTDMTVDGRMITIKDGELNANNNNITITTEGAETIDEANTYVMNAAGEAVTLLSDGTNWFIMGAYGE